MTDDLEITDGKIKRLQNLKLYNGKSRDEIIEMIKAREAVTAAPKEKVNKQYDARFKEKLDMLEKEYGIDMNTSNDPEMLNNLVRQMIQVENTDKDIRHVQDKETKTRDDISTLKALGDFQRDIQMTIADLQDKLGISRKVRKEKAADDIPQFIDGILLKAKDFWNRQTITVDCPKCQIELIRYWLNFPDNTTVATFTSECPHCGEKVTYAR